MYTYGGAAADLYLPYSATLYQSVQSSHEDNSI